MAAAKKVKAASSRCPDSSGFTYENGKFYWNGVAVNPNYLYMSNNHSIIHQDKGVLKETENLGKLLNTIYFDMVRNCCAVGNYVLRNTKVFSLIETLDEAEREFFKYVCLRTCRHHIKLLVDSTKLSEYQPFIDLLGLKENKKLHGGIIEYRVTPIKAAG